MVKKILKGAIVTLTTTLLLTACAGSQENIQHSKVAHSGTEHSEVLDASNEHTTSRQSRYSRLLKKARREAKAEKIVLRKYCFKNNHSIHYRVQERCN